MIPGFVVPYKDIDGYVHLYFYPGYTDDGNPIYKEIIWKHGDFKPDKICHDDGAIDYDFKSKSIKTISCKLVSNIDSNVNIQKFDI